LSLSERLGDDTGAAYALTQISVLAYFAGDLGVATELAEQGLALFRRHEDSFGVAELLSNALGRIAVSRGDYARARQYYEEALAIKRRLGDVDGTAWNLLLMADLARLQMDHARACELFKQSLAMFRSVGNELHVAHCLIGVADSLIGLVTRAVVEHDADSVRELLEETMRVCREMHDPHYAIRSLCLLGKLALSLGDTEQASTFFKDALDVARDRRAHPSVVALLLGDLGQAAAACGHSASAARLFRAAWLIDTVPARQQALVYSTPMVRLPEWLCQLLERLDGIGPLSSPPGVSGVPSRDFDDVVQRVFSDPPARLGLPPTP
jgi:tetratricopeptide (TPR) repeat protein